MAVALGVGALTGVRGFSQAFRGMLLRDARKLMAADLSVRMFALPDEKQEAVMASVPAARTWITESVSMLSTGSGKPPILVSIKAVDPSVYPFYGELRLDPPVPLRDALQPDAIAASDDLMVRLEIQPGATVHIGNADFRIAARVALESDRMAGSLNVGPRILMSREGLERTGLLVPGSRAAQRFLFKLNPDAGPVEEIRNRLRLSFPEAMVIDYRETHPLITRGLDRSTIFLSLVSLIALIVGALGVAMAMHSHLQQKLDSIAVMKSLGAKSSQIIRIYGLQTLMLGALGGLAGVAIGLAIQRVFPILIERYFQISPGWRWDPLSAVQGLAIALLTTLLFTLPPLLSIKQIRPSLILRREMDEPRPGWRSAGSAVLIGAAILCGILAIVWWLSESLRVAAYFTLGLVAALCLLGMVAGGLLHLMRRLGERLPQGASVALRHGMANIYRPGNHAAALLVALSMGVMFTLTTYLIQHSLLAQIANSAPPDMPNVFLINITPKEREGVAALLKGREGVQSGTEVVPLIAARITRLNGDPIEKFATQNAPRRFQQTRSVTWMDEKPPQLTITQGRWFDPRQKFAQLCVNEEVAKVLPVKPGAQIDWIASNRNIAARVVCLYRTEAVRMGANLDFAFSPGSLDGLPVLYFAAIRMKPATVASLQREAFQRFPTVTVINAADVLAIVQDVVDQIALVIRFVSFFSILAGAIILSASVAGTRFRRIREVVILKMLGATRGRIAGIFSVEFVILGAAAGILGSLLANGFSALLLKRLLQAEFRFDLLPNILAVICTALLANAAGWAAGHRILAQKPLAILRETL